MPVKQGTATKR